jgi:hypothetical protein
MSYISFGDHKSLWATEAAESNKNVKIFFRFSLGLRCVCSYVSFAHFTNDFDIRYFVTIISMCHCTFQDSYHIYNKYSPLKNVLHLDKSTE